MNTQPPNYPPNYSPQQDPNVNNVPPAGQQPQQIKQKNNTLTIVIIIICLFIVIPFIVGIVIAITMVNTNRSKNLPNNTNTARTSQDFNIVNDLSQVQTYASSYFNSNKTYVGLDKYNPMITVGADEKLQNSELKIQALSATNFLAYARLSTGEYACTDPLGNITTTKSIDSNATACPR